MVDELVDLMESIQLEVSLVTDLLLHGLDGLGTASLLCRRKLLCEVKLHAKLTQLLLFLIKFLFLYVMCGQVDLLSGVRGRGGGGGEREREREREREKEGDLPVGPTLIPEPYPIC